MERLLKMIKNDIMFDSTYEYVKTKIINGKDIVKDLPEPELKRLAKGIIKEYHNIKQGFLDMTITVPLQASCRPRFTKFKNSDHVHTYMDPKDVKYREMVSYTIRKNLPADWEPVSGRVHIYTIMYIQKQMSNVEYLMQELDLKDCTARPDIDNYLKINMDAMNDIVYVDDGTVSKVFTKKRYTRDKDKIRIVASFWKRYKKDRV